MTGLFQEEQRCLCHIWYLAWKITERNNIFCSSALYCPLSRAQSVFLINSLTNSVCSCGRWTVSKRSPHISEFQMMCSPDGSPVLAHSSSCWRQNYQRISPQHSGLWVWNVKAKNNMQITKNSWERSLQLKMEASYITNNIAMILYNDVVHFFSIQEQMMNWWKSFQIYKLVRMFLSNLCSAYFEYNGCSTRLQKPFV